MQKVLYILTLVLLLIGSRSFITMAQQPKPKWMQLQEGKIVALQQYRQLLWLKDSLQSATKDSFTVSLQREPCDICSKWDLSLYDSHRNYKAFYVIKFNRHNNQIDEIIPLKIKKH
jgi:hypothetical protein